MLMLVASLGKATRRQDTSTAPEPSSLWSLLRMSRMIRLFRRTAASAAAAPLRRPVARAAMSTAVAANAGGTARAARRGAAAAAVLGLALASTPQAAQAAQDASPGPFETLTELPEDAKAFLDEIQRAKDRAKRAIDGNDLAAAEQAYVQALAAARKVDSPSWRC